MPQNTTSFQKKHTSLLPYWQAIPTILKYQLVTNAVLFVCIWLFRTAALGLLELTGHVAISSGDYLFLLTTWQGWLFILLVLLFLFVYVAFDLNTKILFSRNLFQENPPSIIPCMKEAFFDIRRFLNLQGLGVVLYITFLAPIIGTGLSISLTESLYLPNFITSVIYSKPLYLVAYIVAVTAFVIIGILHIFTLHGILIADLDVKAARQNSKRLLKKNWKNFLLENLIFILITLLILLLCTFVVLAFPLAVLSNAISATGTRRGLILFICLLGSALLGLAAMLFTPFYIMRLTQLFNAYMGDLPVVYPVRARTKHPLLAGGMCALLIVCIAGAWGLQLSFDEIFPLRVSVGVIAHRGGGRENAENTVAGLKTAISLGAVGSEIDIQRTKDGYYIVNHDKTFKRVAGVNRKPQNMTLEEIRELSIKNPKDKTAPGEPVATLEEMLDAAKGKLTLFIELKGSTADHQMAEDVIRILQEKDMLGECVLISMKYKLIDYIETNWPQVQTGYLAFAFWGNTADLNCDYFGLEEETATASAIDAIHERGKKALVWTPNNRNSQTHFLTTEADAIITDNVVQANQIRGELEQRSDLQRICDKLLSSW